MPCHAIHPIQDLFLEGFSYVLQIDMHFICTPMWTKFYSCKKWVLHQTAKGFCLCDPKYALLWVEFESGLMHVCEGLC
jgi:hypothetical protein